MFSPPSITISTTLIPNNNYYLDELQCAGAD
jgi:hypothetical protein